MVLAAKATINALALLKQMPPGAGLDTAADKIGGKSNNDPLDSWPPAWGATGGKRPTYKDTANDYGGPTADFDGTNQAMITPTGNTPDWDKTTNGGATLVARVNPTDVATAGNRFILETRFEETAVGMVLYTELNDLHVWSGGTDSEIADVLTNDTEITIGVRWNNATADMDVFIDGLSHTTGLNWGANAIDGGDDWHLGERFTLVNRWKGEIFSIAVWDRNLSDQEMYDAHLATKYREGLVPNLPIAAANDFTLELPTSPSTNTYSVHTPWAQANDFTSELPTTPSTQTYSVHTPWAEANDFTVELPTSTSTETY